MGNDVNPVKMVNAEDFKHWMSEHRDFVTTKIVKESSNWGRIVCTWREKKENSTIKHVFAAAVDLRTGDVYMDCRRSLIWKKNVALACARPIHTIVKTLYHLSLVGVATEIYQSARGRQTKMEGLKNSFKSLADIVRTPLYGIAMTIVNIAAVAITPFSVNMSYDMRKLHGRIEQELNWGEKHTDWTLALCFQSGFNVFKDDFGANPAKRYSEEIYQLKKEHLEERIAKKNERINQTESTKDRAVLIGQLDELQDRLDELNDTNTIGNLEQQIAEASETLKTITSPSERKTAKSKIKSLKKELHQLEEANEVRFVKKLRYRISDTKYDHKFDQKIEKLKVEMIDLKKAAHETDNKVRKKHYKDKISELEKEIAKLRTERNLDIRLTNFARALIKNRRNNYNPFYQLIGKLDPNKQYISEKIETLGRTQRLRLLKSTQNYLERAQKHLKDISIENNPHRSEIGNALLNLKKAVKSLEKEYKAEGNKKKASELRELKDEGEFLKHHLKTSGFNKHSFSKKLKVWDKTSGDTYATVDFSERSHTWKGQKIKKSGMPVKKQLAEKDLSHWESVVFTGPDVREVSRLVTIKDKKARNAAISTFEGIVDDLLSSLAAQIEEGRIGSDEFKTRVKIRFKEELEKNRGTDKHPETMLDPIGTEDAKDAINKLVDGSEFKKWLGKVLNESVSLKEEKEGPAITEQGETAATGTVATTVAKKRHKHKTSSKDPSGKREDVDLKTVPSSEATHHEARKSKHHRKHRTKKA